MNKKLLLGVALAVGMGAGFTSCVDNTESQSVIDVRNAKAAQLKSLATLNEANAEAAIIAANAEKAVKEASASYQKAQEDYIAAQAELLRAQAAAENANVDLKASQAELNKANAALINAQAEYEAALTAARNAQTEADKQKLEAELERAKVLLEQEQARVDQIKAETEKILADAEQQRAYADYQKGQAEYQYALAAEKRANLQSVIANAEVSVAQAKNNLLKAEQEYDKLLAGVEKEQLKELAILISQNKIAQATLLDKQRDLATAQVNLAEFEAGVLTPAEAINVQIDNLMAENTESQIKINGAQAVIDTYGKYAGQTVTRQEVLEAKAKYEAAKTVKGDAEKAKTTAKNVLYGYWNAEKQEQVPSAKQPLDDWKSEIDDWVDQVNISYSTPNEILGEGYDDNYDVTIEKVTESSAPADVKGLYCVVIKQTNNAKNVQYLPLFEGNAVQDDNTINYELSSGAETYPYQTYASYYNLINDGKALDETVTALTTVLTPQKTAYDKALKTAQETLTKKQSAYDKAVTDLAKAQKTYDDALAAAKAAAEKKVADAKKAIEDNKDESKAAQLAADLAAANAALENKDYENVKAVTDADTALGTAKGAKTIAAGELVSAQAGLNLAQGNVNTYSETMAQIDQLKEGIAGLVADGKENINNIASYNEAATSYAKAVVAYNEADDKESVALGEYEPIQYAFNGLGSNVTETIVDGDWYSNHVVTEAKNTIAEAKDDIAENDNLIAELKQDLKDIEDGKYDDSAYQASIETARKAFVEAVEDAQVEFDAAKKSADLAQKALDAAIGADSAE